MLCEKKTQVLQFWRENCWQKRNQSLCEMVSTGPQHVQTTSLKLIQRVLIPIYNIHFCKISVSVLLTKTKESTNLIGLQHDNNPSQNRLADVW